MTELSIEERIGRLLTPERRERLDVHRILSLIPLRPYLTVADIGCGPGLFAIPLAKSMWDGQVIAVDVDEDMVEEVRRRAKEARLGNITAVKSEPDTLPLEPASLDGVLLVCVLHEVEDKEGFLKKVAETLRRGAWCAVIEWRADKQQDEGPPAGRRIDDADLVRMGSDVGLRSTLRRELNDYHYMLVFNK